MSHEPGWTPPRPATPPPGWGLPPVPPAGWTPPLPDPRALPPHLRPALPVEERDYYAFWRAPRYRWWKGLLAILMAAFGFLVSSTVLTFIGWSIDGVDLQTAVLPDGWRELIGLHQLHPLLVHAELFGGGYRHRAVAIAGRYS